MKQLFKFFIILFLCACTSFAQETVRKHTVSNGETLVSIAKKYNVTPYELEKANPGILDGIENNDVLNIPYSSIRMPKVESVADSIKSYVNNSAETYTVLPGDTKFSLSNRFGLSISELESQNPHILNGITTGQVLDVHVAENKIAVKQITPIKNPIKSETVIVQVDAEPLEKDQKHVVLKDETLWSISQKYGLTVTELVNANPEVKSGVIIVGYPLAIPNKEPLKTTRKSETTKVSPNPVIKEETTIIAKNSETIVVKSAENKQESPKDVLPEIANPKTADSKPVSPKIADTPATPKVKPEDSPQTITPFKQQPIAISKPGVMKQESPKFANAEKTTDFKPEPVIAKSETTPKETVTASNDEETYIVQSGDTKFGLAKRFNISIGELERQNPEIVKMLVVNQEIHIASKEPKKTASPAKKESIAENATVELPKKNETPKPTVAPIETVVIKTGISEEKEIKSNPPAAKSPEAVSKPSISKEKIEKATVKEAVAKKPEASTKIEKDKSNSTKTAVAIKAPETADPIKEVKTPVTEVVKEDPITAHPTHEDELVPNKSKIETPVETDKISENTYVSYEIQPNETLYELLLKSGMATSDFYKLNPQLKDGAKAGTRIKLPRQNSMSNASGPDHLKFKSLVKSLDVSKPEKLLFFLPFSQSEYDSYASNGYNFKTNADDFKKAHLEFYKGANIAIDSIKKLNVKLDVKIIEAQNITMNSKAIPEDIKTYDAIILPYYGAIEEDIANLTVAENIPVVTAAAIPYKSTANNLFSALPTANQQRKKVLDYMMSKNSNIIVINDYNRVESRSFISEYAVNAKFIDLKRNGSLSEQQLISNFKKDQLNFIVIDSERNSVFLSATNILLGELSNYNVQIAVLEAALIPSYDDVSQTRYRILKMLFPSLTPAEITPETLKFNAAYNKKFNAVSTTHVRLGFDITFDTLLRIAQQESFQNSAATQVTEYTQLKIDYHKNATGGYMNDSIYILQYDTGSDIKEAQ